MKADVAAFLCILSFFVGIVVPAIIGVLIGFTPDTLTRQADAGQFVSANASAGGFFTPGTTSVQTTRGSYTIAGQFSADRGQPMRVTETTKHGVRLCVSGRSDSCADIAGTWVGRTQPVAHAHHFFAPLVTHIGAHGVAIWIMLGVLVTFALTGITAAATELETSDGNSDSNAQR